MPGSCPLPNYSSVIRWTVQDVINWLGQNRLKESIPNFRLAGVDGNKLLNCTDTDLAGISCPDKEIRIIMNFIKQVDTPNRPFANASPYRQNVANVKPPQQFNKSDGYERPIPPTHVDSGEDSDEDDWGSDFVVKKVPKDQVTLRPPPRKKRPIVYRRSVVQPVVPDSEPEDYLEPEPLSKPPPAPPTGRAPPSQSKNNSRGNRRVPPPRPASPEQDQDDYMDPEAPQPPPPAQRRPPPKPVAHQKSEELYDDPDKTVQVQNVHGGPLPPLPSSRPSVKPANQRRAPSQRQHIPPPRSRVQEPDSSSEDACYDQPDEDLLKVVKPPKTSVPKRPGKSKQTQPKKQEEQEVYEEPDVPAPLVSANKLRNKKGKKPSPLPEPDQEVYEDPDVDQPETPLAPPVPRNVPKRPSSSKPAQQEPEDYEEPEPPGRPEPPPNIPRRPVGKQALPDEQEVYEDPDVPSQAPSVPQPPRDIPKRPGKKPPASAPVEQDVYEVPDVEVNDDGNGEDYLDMSEGSNLPPLSDRLAKDDDDNVEDYLDMNEGGILPTPPSRWTTPTRKMTNDKISKSQTNRQTPVPKPPPQSPPEEETYEEPDAPPPRPPVTQVKDPPKNFRPPPVRNKENYTQVHIKEDKGSPKPVAAVTPSAPGNEILDKQKWFYGDTNRQVIRERLQQHKVNGMYVIRNSTKSPTEPYTLQIFYEGNVYNLSIRRREDNKYAIGAVKADEKGFSTLLEMINFFKQNFLVLQGGSQTKLLRSLPKE